MDINKTHQKEKFKRNIKIRQLLEVGAHYGCHKSHVNPKMFPYIFDQKSDGTHIINLIKTNEHLEKACKYLQQAAEENKIILFVGTKKEAALAIQDEAKNCNSYYICHRWIGGLLTNWKTTKPQLDRLRNLEQLELTKQLDLYPPKEQSIKRSQLTALRRDYGGIKEMKRIPDILIVVDQEKESTAIKEARSLHLCIVSILDTNCNPDLIDIPVPGNTKGIKSIKFFLQSFAKSILTGKQKKKELLGIQKKK